MFAACPAALPVVADEMLVLHAESICPAHAPDSPAVITLCVAGLHGINRLHDFLSALVRISPHFAFSIEENAARRKWKYDDPKFDCRD
jgi:hypothetical protein